jgi:hypothetical protein
MLEVELLKKERLVDELLVKPESVVSNATGGLSGTTGNGASA